MLAVLPRQNADAVGGELFVETYRRQLGHLPDDAITFLADTATRECNWFPTIAQCLDMVVRWRRSDAAVQRRAAARDIARREQIERDNERRWPPRVMSQEEVDNLPGHLVKLGISAGYLRTEGDRVVYNPDDAGAGQ